MMLGDGGAIGDKTKMKDGADVSLLGKAKLGREVSEENIKISHKFFNHKI
jgi:hypothetical protein